MEDCDSDFQFWDILPLMSHQDLRTSKQLLGAVCAIRLNDLDGCFKHLDEALRHPSPEDRQVDLSETSPELNYMTECITRDQLSNVASDQIALATQVILLTKRILGGNHALVHEAYFWLGTVIGENSGQINQVFLLWEKTLFHSWQGQNYDLAAEVLFALSSLASSLCETSCDVAVTFAEFSRVSSTAVNVLRQQKETLLQGASPDDMPPQHHEASLLSTVDSNARSVFVLLRALHGLYSSPEHRASLRSLLTSFLECKPRFTLAGTSKPIKGYTPLHLACDPSSLLLFPQVLCDSNLLTSLDEEFIQLLVEGGARVNDEDACGSTPLHVLSATSLQLGDFSTRHAAACLLISQGCHVDWKNDAGISAYESIQKGSPVSEAITTYCLPLPLRCLVATCISNNKLNMDSLPIQLKQFVIRH